MKKMTLCLLILGLLISCNTRKKSAINEDTDGQLKSTLIEHSNYPNFVYDSTYKRQYLDDSTFTFVLDNREGEVCTAKTAFKIAESILISFLGEKEVSYQKPFHINLINNEIWVIEGTLHQAKDGIAIGRAAYIEIQKSNGEILKFIPSE